ncbi:UV excision repair protein Rad23 [Rozella allomycis CSF55]|uniref:UV excision repair protein RAD23 n=1 Tax=Rozella allomycis (strain CSF55) TaxID=988480 RepID=A0A4P9YI57_ROZAC|nr:UV excision repair protein Rad23 [Rozella allomycis CSF55]
MKITLRTLQQKSYPLEVEPESTVSTLKTKIEGDFGHPVASQKLIYSGQILQDDRTIASYNVKENDFFVLMITKAPMKAPAAVSTPSTPVASNSSVPVAKTSNPPETSGNVASTESATAAGNAPSQPHPSQMFGVSREQYEAMLNNLVEMGFPKEQVVIALKASYFNADRAVEFLMNQGIPSDAAENNQAPPTAPNPVTPAATGNAVAQESLPSNPNALSGISSDPQLQQLRQIVQSNPQVLQPLLQQLGMNNPELMQVIDPPFVIKAISENPEAFLQMLSQQGENMEEYDEGTEQEGVQYIQVTPEEEEAINRLTALGFDRVRAIEAFFACDKNETMAANYLFDSMDEQ